MTKNTKTLIVVLGVLLLLGGVYYWSITRSGKTAVYEPPEYTPYPSIGNLESSKLVKIELNSMVLEKNNYTWELVSLEGKVPPVGIELDQREIQSLTYYLASMWAEQIVDEEPSDISQYGLDKPSYRAFVIDSDGERVEYILGDMTPSRLTYYVMEAGDPRVYIVAAYTAGRMMYTLDDIRQRYLFPAFEFSEVERFSLESRLTKIDISIKPKSLTPDRNSMFSSHLVTSPYKRPRGANGEAVDSLLTPFQDLFIADFVDDAPESLKSYGLDEPVRIFLQTVEETIDLLIGKEVDGKHYAKLAGTPGVFTLYGMGSVIDVKPFTLIDKFAFIVSIDWVEHISINGGEKNLSADLQGEDDDAVYSLNGRKTKTDSFRTFYQAVIGLLIDSEYPGPVGQNENSGELTIEYRFRDQYGDRESFTLIPYNRDFYALKQDGATEFLISRNQVRRIYETADAMVYDD
jgi:hypothetical protein